MKQKHDEIIDEIEEITRLQSELQEQPTIVLRKIDEVFAIYSPIKE